MAPLDLFKLSFLVTALFSGSDMGGLRVFPPTCNRIECPSYDVVHDGDGFEIRRYDSSMWISTQLIDGVSLVEGGRIGFRQLYAYIQGKNENHEKIEMTAPVLNEIKPSDEPTHHGSSFVVSFYVPKGNQATTPAAEGLALRKWGPTYAAVRQFGGFATDEGAGKQAAALWASLAGTAWLDLINMTHGGDPTTEYIVAQYNSPFEIRNRVNEIWLTFDADGGAAV